MKALTHRIDIADLENFSTHSVLAMSAESVGATVYSKRLEVVTTQYDKWYEVFQNESYLRERTRHLYIAVQEYNKLP